MGLPSPPCYSESVPSYVFRTVFTFVTVSGKRYFCNSFRKVLFPKVPILLRLLIFTSLPILAKSEVIDWWDFGGPFFGDSRGGKPCTPFFQRKPPVSCRLQKSH
jgi:hypothetical protein